MRILHLNNELNIACGVTRYIINLCNNSKEIHDCFIIAINGNASDRLKQNDLNFAFFNSVLPNPLKFVVILFRILFFCKKNKIDVIHAHHRYFDLIAFFINKVISVKTVTTVHSKVYGKTSISYKSKKIIAVSETIKNHLIKIFNVPNYKISVIYNFIDENEIQITKKRDELKNELQIDKRKKILLFYGRLSKEKGIDVLLDAFKIICNSHNDVVLLIIGDGDEKEVMIKYLEDQKGSMIYLSSQSDIFNYINISDLVIMPSRTDPFPFAMLEAGSLEKVLVGARVDGIEEFIDDNKNGILFDSENVKELADKVVKILNNWEETSILGKKLNQKVAELSGEKIMKQIFNLYNS